MRLLWIMVAGLYWMLLTVMLLAPDPAALLDAFYPRAVVPLGVGCHFLAFALLTALLLAACWPRLPAWTLLLLVAYAGLTEWLQQFFPPRQMEVRDYAEDVLGIVVAAFVYWLVLRRLALGKRPHRTAALREVIAAQRPQESVRQ